MSDHYASLGVDREATRAEIDEAFTRERDMAWSDERIRELKDAYQTLADPFAPRRVRPHARARLVAAVGRRACAGLPADGTARAIPSTA